MRDEDRQDPAAVMRGALQAATDSELIARVRDGDADAYGELFLRHREVALRYARRLATGARAEDLCAEAFAKILDLLQRGKGPEVAFRAYLLTTVRTSYLNSLRVARREELTSEPVGQVLTVTEDPDERFDREAVYRALSELPERWQTVLWLTTVENRSNEEIGARLGIKPNAVASLAFRARVGLRQAFLAAHLQETDDPQCQQVIGLLPGYRRGTLTRRRRTSIEDHLSTCTSCSIAALEVTEVDERLGAILAPLAFTGAAATGTFVPVVLAKTGFVAGVKATASGISGQLNHWIAGAPGVLGAKVAVAATVAAVGVTYGAHEWERPAPHHAPTVTVDVTDQAAPTPQQHKSSPHVTAAPRVVVDPPVAPRTTASTPSAPPTSTSATPSAPPTTRGYAARTMSVGKMQSETHEEDGETWNLVTIPVERPADNAVLQLVSNRTHEAHVVTPLGGNGWSCTAPLVTLDGLLLHYWSTTCTYHGSPTDRADLVVDSRVGSASHLGVVLVPPMGYLDLSMLDNVGLLNLLA